MRRLAWALAAVLVVALPGASEAGDNYGAIALSKTTRALGWVYDIETQDEAESAALINCSDFAADCEPLIWFRNACGAVAIASDGSYGASWGEDQATAEKKSLATCSQYAKDCQIARWVCTTR